MNRWFLIPDEDKKVAYNQISSNTGLPAYAIEKDWWVVQTLAILFELEIGQHLIFKGGTSLSKSWNLIKRFSEDIDLAIDRSFFGFEGELNKSNRTKLRKASKKYISTTLFESLQRAYTGKGILDIKYDIQESSESDLDPVSLYVYYPEVVNYPDYIDPRVRIEIGCRSLREPFENRPIISMLDQIYPETDFAQKPIHIPSVLPERTFLEKIFLLHEEFHCPQEKMKVDRLSRHLFDIYELSKTTYAIKALEDKQLYEIIVKHRNSFTKVGGVDYNLHQPQNINFIPPNEIIKAWREDYKTMQEQMIHGDSPDFDELIESLTELKTKINSLGWRMDISF